MPFLKKAEVTRKKIENLIQKEKDLADDLIRVAKKVEKRKNEVSALLGKICLGENRTTDEKDLDSLKTLYGKAQNEHTDLLVMIDMVRREKQLLGFELDECTLRESGPEMQSIAQKFNQKLDDTLKSLESLEKDFAELQGMETEFVFLANGHSKALSRLGKTQGLELSESLGKLALVPSPHGYTFTTGTELKVFVGNLEAYRKRLSGYELFKADNPSFEKDVRETREGQREKPWARMTANWTWF